MDQYALGKRIREERIHMGLTQEELAEQINVSTTYIGFIERGERSVTLDKLCKLANCLHVSIDYLLLDSIPAEESAQTRRILQIWNNANDQSKALILDIAQCIVKQS